MTHPPNAYQPHAQPYPAPSAPAIAQFPPAVSPLRAAIKFKSRHTFDCRYTHHPRTKFAVETSDGEIMVYCYLNDLAPYEVGQQVIVTQASPTSDWKLDAKATRTLYGEGSASDQAHVNKAMPALAPAPQPAPVPQVQPRPASQRSGGNAESFEVLLAAKVALLADLDRRVAREVPKASDESRQKHTDTLFIDVRKTQSDDDLIAWAARKANQEMGF